MKLAAPAAAGSQRMRAESSSIAKAGLWRGNQVGPEIKAGDAILHLGAGRYHDHRDAGMHCRSSDRSDAAPSGSRTVKQDNIAVREPRGFA